MTRCSFSIRRSFGMTQLLQFRIWHMALLAAYVAIAIVDIKDNRRTEPALIALAASGFAGYALLCWLAWHGMRCLQPRFGKLPVVIVYLVMMATLFLAATVIYLVLEHAYLV
jgi:hypothetical protein